MGQQLVIGGTDGLGLAIAKCLQQGSARVQVTGRSPEHVSAEPYLDFMRLDIGTNITKLGNDLDAVLEWVGCPLDTIVYAPGFNQMKPIEELSDEEIVAQINVCMTAFAMLMSRVVRRQESVQNLIVISSTSQVRPREHESIYAGGKAGLAHLARSIASDKRGVVETTLVALVSGMDTKLQRVRGIDTSALLRPEWVAEQILGKLKAQTEECYLYQEWLFLRDPSRTVLRNLE